MRYPKTIYLIIVLLVGLAGWQNPVTVQAASSIAVTDVAGLIDAINTANDETTNPGVDVIDLSGNTLTFSGAHTTRQALPVVTSEIVLQNGVLNAGSTQFGLINVASNGHLTLENITVQDFMPLTYGTINNSGTLVIRNSIFRSNRYTIISSNQLLIEASEFHDGLEDGVYTSGDTTVIDSVFRSNTRNGLQNDGGTLVIRGSSFLANGEAGLLTAGGQVHEIQSSIFQGNVEHGLSVQYSHGGSVNIPITNSLFVGNGINGIISTSPVAVTNSTISGNANAGLMAGDRGTHIIRNSILWGNQDDFKFSFPDLSSVVIEHTLIPNIDDVPGSINAEPLFVNQISHQNAPSLAGDYRLQPLSPAIDAGDNTAALNAGTGSVDLAANPRYVDDAGVLDRGTGSAPLIDVGAYEFQGDSSTACAGYTFPYTVTGGQPDLSRAILCASVNSTADVIDLNGNSITLSTSHEGINALPSVRSDITLRNGSLDGGSRALRMFYVSVGGTLTLDTIQLRGGLFRYVFVEGTVIYNSGTVTLLNSILEDNGAYWRHVSAVFNIGQLTVQESVLRRNNSIVIQNERPGTLMVRDSQFTANQNRSILNASTDAVIIQSLFNGNSYGVISTGRFLKENPPASLSLINSTISGNAGTPINANTNLTIQNSIIYGNDSENDTIGTYRNASDTEPWQSVELNATVEHTLIEGGYDGTGNVSISPRFFDPVSYTVAPTDQGDYRLRTLSPAIDSGSNTAAMAGSVGTTDLATMPRYADDPGVVDAGPGTAPVIDMGAYESRGDSSAACAGYAFPYTVTGGELDLTQAILCANINNTADIIDLNGGTIHLSIAYETPDQAVHLPEITDQLTIQNGTLDSNNETLPFPSPKSAALMIGAHGHLTLDSVTISDARVWNYGVLDVTRSGFEEKSGFYNEGTLTVSDSSFVNNELSIENFGQARVQHGRFENNWQLARNYNTLTLVNNLIIESASVLHVEDFSGQITVVNNTIIDSDRIYFRNGSDYASTTIANNILYAAEVQLSFEKGPVRVEHNIIAGGYPGTGNLDVNPLFVNASAGDYRLHYASRAIDAGSNSIAAAAGVPTMDLDGNPRYMDDSGLADYGEGTVPLIDIGAYEFQGTSPCGQYSFPYTVTGGESDLADAIHCANYNPGADFIDLNGATIAITQDYSLPGDPVILPVIRDSLTLANGTIEGSGGTDTILLRNEFKAPLTLDQLTLSHPDGTILQANASMMLTNSTLTGAHTGLYVSDGYPETFDVTIQDSTIQGNTQWGVYADRKTGLTVQRSTISGNPTGIRSVSSTHIIVTESLFENNQTGAYVEMSQLAFSDNTVRGNTETGLYLDGRFERGTVTRLENNVFSGNQSGMSASFIGNILLSNHRFEDNTDGALNIRGGTSVIEDSVFLNNEADRGGAIEIASDTIIRRSVLQGNQSAYSGGAIDLKYGNYLHIYDSLITGNSTGSSGGAIYSNGTVQIENTTIAGNHSASKGAALYYRSNRNSLTIRNSVITGNTAADVPDQIFISSQFPPRNISVTYTAIDGGYEGTGNIALSGDMTTIFVDPRDASPVPVADGDYHLATDSPVINMGDNSGIAADAVDLDGNPRVQGGWVDPGAYESSQPGIDVSFAGADSGPEPEPVGQQLAIQTVNGNPTAQDFSVLLTVDNETTQADDYTLSANPATLIIPAGTNNGERIDLAPYITIVDDNQREDDEQMRISVRGGGVRYPPEAVLYTIIDNDEPEIDVRGNDILISSGDTTPQADDNTYLGRANIATVQATGRFTIHNTGNIELLLTGDDPVSISGPHAADFSVVTAPVTPILSNEETFFEIQFTPGATGLREATITILNDDEDEGTYTFTIAAEGFGTYDVNQDGIVSPTDAVFVINRAGQDVPVADVNQDGIVDQGDVQMIQNHLGD